MKLYMKILLFFSFLLALQGNCNVSFSQELKYIKNDTLPEMFYLTFTEIPNYSMTGYICVKEWLVPKEQTVKKVFITNPNYRRTVFKISVKGQKDLKIIVRDYYNQIIVLEELFVTKHDDNLVVFSEKAKVYAIELSNLGKNPVNVLVFAERNLKK